MQTRLGTFWWLNYTQLFGALNDNLFKLFVILFLIDRYGTSAALHVSAVATAVFVLPFLLFATTAGFVADRFSKKRVVNGVKMAELTVMLLACAAFARNSILGVYAALFLMATQSALFGPSKFGIIPELVGHDNLSRANSLLAAFTYLAIVLGTAGGPLIAELTAGRYTWATAVCVAVAGVGLATSFRVGYTTPARSGKRLSPLVVTDIWRTLYSIRSDRFLLLAVLGSAYFLLIGAFIQISLIPYGIEALALTQTDSAYLFILAAVGIGIGTLLAGKISGDNIEFGLVPVGAIGMTVTAIGLAVGPALLVLVMGFIFLMGFSVGFFVVPINAFIQFRSPRRQIGEILAASSFLSWVGVLVTAVFLQFASAQWDLSARQGFLIVALLTLILSVISIRVLPDFLVRFLGYLITHTLYRVRVIGKSHYPAQGPALLISNHVSYVDPVIISAIRPRRVRFMMNREMYEFRWLHPMYKLMGVIPISFRDPPKKIAASLRAAREALDEGYVVCMFAEGGITRTGFPQAFKPGFEHVVRKSGYPIVPVYLGGMWGSTFSYAHGPILSRGPAKFPHRLSVLFGEPLPPTRSAAEVRQAVLELSCDYFDSLKPRRKPLGRLFIRTARRNWRQKAASDATGQRLTYGQMLTAALALARRIRKITGREEKIGVLLPPSVSGALANLAVTCLGRVAVNLNYSTSADNVTSAIEQCGIRTVITARAFLEKIDAASLPARKEYVEDLLADGSPFEKGVAWLKARWVPSRLLGRVPRWTADSLLTVIFTSGSAGAPKGVMLSHHNVLSNIEALRMVFRVASSDDICSVLPLFHAFGYTGTLWFPFLSGFSASYHPNPLDGAGVAGAIRTNRSTLLISTPTFLTAYLRRGTREDFASLRMVVVGAEKLPQRLADRFEEQLGLRPLEGYGATELSPVVSMNVPDVTVGPITQLGTKPGSVGHPLPGVAVKVVDMDTEEALPDNEAGLLLVKGPNVMRGYLNQPELTQQVVGAGWYRTGDVASVDGDGFITIEDRVSRFSKVGGEMVPHVALEEAYHHALQTTEQVLAVTSVPDGKKGERLVVLYTPAAGDPDELHGMISERNLPNLWRPRRQDYYLVDEIPVLGSGKIDLKRLKALAARATGQSDDA